MNKLIKLVMEYQIKKTENIFAEIIITLQPIINKYLCKVDKNEREDLQQELYLGTEKAMRNFKFKKNKIPENLFTKENFDLLKKNKFEISCFIYILHDEYIFSFIKKYGSELFISAFYSKQKSQQFNQEYSLSCIENQFMCFLNNRYSWITNDYNRKNKNSKMFSLNIVYENKLELTNIIIEDKYSIGEINIFEEFKIARDDEKFLRLFIENGKIISQQAVSKKLNVSQQLISKKLKMIKEKYKKVK